MKVFSPGADNNFEPIDGFGVFFKLLWRHLISQGVEVVGTYLNTN